MMENYIHIPAAWCRDKQIISGCLTLEAAREIAESGIPDRYMVPVKAYYGRKQPFGETLAPAGAVRAKFREKMLARSAAPFAGD